MTTQKIFYVSYGQLRLLPLTFSPTIYITPPDVIFSTMLFQEPHTKQCSICDRLYL